MRYFRLTEDKRAVPCGRNELDMEIDARRVDETVIGEVRISTVFMGLDHNWGDGPPLLFETMVFGGDLDKHQTRCSTWDEAVKMHGDACARVRRTFLKVVA